MGAAKLNREHAERDALHAVAPLLELVASAEPLAVLLKALVLFVERTSSDMRCSILLADTARRTLRHGAAPNLPADYCAAIDGVSYGECQGSCGTAAARKEMVIVADIQQSPLWRDYRDLARRHGLAACWSIPLLDGAGEVLGTFAIYYPQPREPTPAELDVLRVAGPLGTLVVQRHRDAERLRASELRYRQLTETCPDGVITHRDGRISYANAAAASLLGVRRASTLVGKSLAEFCSAEVARELLAYRTGMHECQLHRADRTTVATEVTATMLTVDGGETILLICRNVTDRKNLENDLVDAASREQENLGYDLHDGIGQQLAGISMLLGALANELRVEQHGAAPELELINSLVTQTIEDTRRLAYGLAPVTVEHAGLSGALRTLARDARTLYGLTVAVRADRSMDAALATDRATHLYRIAQEAVRNAARHARARRVRVLLEAEGDQLLLTVTDDGVGMAREVPPKAGLGLRSMHYRAHRLGGTIRVEARSPHGTRIRVCCPAVSALPA